MQVDWAARTARDVTILMAAKAQDQGEVMNRVSVILPAAGAGRRFGGEESKVFHPLDGRAIVLRALEAFVGRDDVCQVQLVLSQQDMDLARQRFRRELDAGGVSLTIGGDSRTESVRNALGRLADSAELVCVHDAVRPCISQESIDAVIGKAAETGAAILAWPVHGTLKRAGPDGTIESTVSRKSLWQAQTPQVFARELIERAYAGATRGVTDDAALVEAAGHEVTLVPGDPGNIKITTPEDLALAEAILHVRRGDACGPPRAHG